MKRAATPLPTKTELAILGVLWQRGPSTVRQIRDALRATRPTGYTSILKLLQLMMEKHLVARDASRRSHVYRAARPAAETRHRLLDDLIVRAFGGSAKTLILQALSAERASADELEEIRRFLDQGPPEDDE